MGRGEGIALELFLLYNYLQNKKIYIFHKYTSISNFYNAENNTRICSTVCIVAFKFNVLTTNDDEYQITILILMLKCPMLIPRK